MMPYEYEKDGQKIYQKSFATIRSESSLEHFTEEEEVIAVRMIHASGMVKLAKQIQFSKTFAISARSALLLGAPILCDSRMVAEGITKSRLPAGNKIICTLNEAGVLELARKLRNTRSAAALEYWRPHLSGAIVAIGNAPTALFHLLNILEEPNSPKPAAIIGCPVGFVGAMESKEALWQACPSPCCIVRGRLGGSAITVAAINALAGNYE